MSGGVDSSVAAYLIKKRGFKVVGIFVKSWNDDQCGLAKDYNDALSVAESLNIPIYSFDFSKEYKERVFCNFLCDIKNGKTPNPDILCNKEIKFNVLLKKAKLLGAEALATGHYAQISNDTQLLRGKDTNKDQSYFLYTLKRELLQEIIFPIGNMHKCEVRKLAKTLGFITHEKKDSTGICFIGKRNFKNFLMNYIPPSPGVFKTEDGKIIGHHNGAYYYTIGQREGLGIGGPGEAWFVSKKDVNTGEVTIVQGTNHQSLFSSKLVAGEVTWVNEEPATPLKCEAKIRYRQVQEKCIIEKIEAKKLFVKFLKPQRAITEGQSIVFYDGEICLGGGVIENKHYD